MGKDGRNSERVTTSISKDQKARLDRLASDNKVSAAWLQRRAIEQLLDKPQAVLPRWDQAGA